MVEQLPAGARQAVEGVLTKKLYDFKILEKSYPKKAGVFVQIYCKGEPRGCVGFPEPVHSIGKATVMAAKAAAFEDPRFLPLKKEMLSDCKFQVCVVEKMAEEKWKRQDLPKKIKPGNGLIVRFGPSEGILLPHEMEDFKPEESLEAVCEKAGLAPETWMDENAKIYSFAVKTYSE